MDADDLSVGRVLLTRPLLGPMAWEKGLSFWWDAARTLAHSLTKLVRNQAGYRLNPKT
jgi:hypothetical protein